MQTLKHKPFIAKLLNYSIGTNMLEQVQLTLLDLHVLHTI